MDFALIMLRFRTPLAVNAKGCLNSNTVITFYSESVLPRMCFFAFY